MYLLHRLFTYIFVALAGHFAVHEIEDSFNHRTETPSASVFHMPSMPAIFSTSVSIKDPAGSIHFAPEENIEPMDIYELNKAQDHLDISMYAFTDCAIADAVVNAARRGVRVRVYRDNDQYIQELHRYPSRGCKGVSVAQRLASNRNISVRVKGEKELMHIKGWTADNIMVREGSANWSPAGESRQDNTATFFENRPAAAEFERKFERMWERPDNIVIQ